MTPQEKRKELLSATLVKNLEKRHFEAYYCPTAAEAVEKALSLIPEGSSVTWGGSMTIRDMGLTKAVKEGNYNVIDRDTAANPAEMREMMRQGLLTDFYLTSTNAMIPACWLKPSYKAENTCHVCGSPPPTNHVEIALRIITAKIITYVLGTFNLLMTGKISGKDSTIFAYFLRIRARYIITR